MEVYPQPHNFSHHHIFTTPTPPGAKVLRAELELSQTDHWVAWSWGAKKHNGKQPKLPINPHTGERADTTNARTWGSITQATTAVEEYGCAGIGFVFSGDDPYTGVDLDDCVENGEVAPWAMEIVEKLASYTEVSPSGTGLKVWIKASKPGDRCRTGDIEMYDSGRFFTFTGQRFAGIGIEERQDELDELYRRLWPPDQAPQAGRRQPRSSQDTLDDLSVLEKAKASQLGRKFEALFDRGNPTGGDHSRSDYELLKMLAFWTGKDPDQMERLFSQSALGRRKKWTGRKNYRQRTIKRACEAVGKVYDPEHSKPKETTREILQSNMVYALMGHQWGEGAPRTDAAATDYFVYRAILGIMYRTNKTTAGIGERECAEAAGIGSLETVSNSLRRLRDNHSLLVKVASGKKGKADTYGLKTVDSKPYQSLIRKEMVLSLLVTNNTVTIRSECTVLSQTQNLRNPAPDMPDFDRNGRRLPKGKQDPLKKLGKVKGWILDMVLVARSTVSLSLLSERTGIRPNNLKARHTNPMIVAGLLKDTGAGYIPAVNVGEALGEELELSGCNEAARRQRERHERDREAYRTRKERPVDKEPIRGEVAMIEEDFSGIEEKPLPSPLAVALHDYLERNPQATDETPSWIANTIWAFELYPGKPTCYEVTSALEELGLRKSHATRRVA